MRAALPLPIGAAAAALGGAVSRCPLCTLPSPREVCGRCLRRADIPYPLRLRLSRGQDRRRIYYLAPYPDTSRHGSPLREALLAFKFHGRRYTGRRLCRLLALAAGPLQGRFDALCHVPLSPSRLRERGFNQAAWLARAVSRKARIAHRSRTLVRVGDGPAQSRTQGRAQRLALHAGHFRARGGEGTLGRVLLVDDVYTTGATSSACCEVLRAAGAESVTTLVLLIAKRSAGPSRR